MRIAGPALTIDGVDYQLEMRHLEQTDVDAVWELYADSDADHLGKYSKYRAMMDTNICARENEAFDGSTVNSTETIVLVANGRVVGIHRARYVDGVAKVLNQAIVPDLRSKGLGTVFNQMLRAYGFNQLGIVGAEFESRKGKPAIEGFARQLEISAADEKIGVTGQPLDVYRFTKEDYQTRLKSSEAAAAEAAVAKDIVASLPKARA